MKGQCPKCKENNGLYRNEDGDICCIYCGCVGYKGKPLPEVSEKNFITQKGWISRCYGARPRQGGVRDAN